VDELVESADQPLLVRFGLWHHEQVVPSLRCPAVEGVFGEGAELLVARIAALSSTTARRPVKPWPPSAVRRDDDQATRHVGHAGGDVRRGARCHGVVAQVGLRQRQRVITLYE
jgi:hypothetical protein